MSLKNIIARGVVALSDAAKKMQTVQVRLLANETKDGLEHFEPYGYTARPQPGAEAVVLFVEGDRSHGVCIAVADRRYRLQALEEGEVALYDDLGQTIRLGRNGIYIEGQAVTVTDCNVTVTGGDVIADGISLKNHHHGGVQTGGGTTGSPI